MKVSFWFVAIASIFVTCLLTANIIAVKLIVLLGFLVPAGIIIFPLSYLFGDVLTEVYGYGAARRVIWLGFACNLLAVIAIFLAGL
ncbi:MAG TPA: VUT family protein, partial [Ktedonobacteraceae bacterium]|nr:VUT family protein [Ktedonobacteraceae bacterium]